MRAARLALACALVLVLVGGLGGAAATNHDEEPAPGFEYDIDVESNGDATWTLRARFPNESESDREAFEELAAIYEEDEGDVYLPVEPYQSVVQDIGTELDRSMSIQVEDRTVEQTEEHGILSVSFVWTNFAVVEEDRVRVGDVFDTGDRIWFTRLDGNEELFVHAPDEHTVESSGLPVENRTMSVAGPRDLRPEDLSVTFVGGDADGGVPLLGWVLGLAGILVVLVLLAIVYGLGPLDSGTEREPVGARGSTTDASAEEAPIKDDDEAVSDDALLGDEERVLGLVERNGGRMKQANIVTETDWSNAKVSQLLSQMADDGDVEKLRIGRENLIRLPDEGD